MLEIKFIETRGCSRQQQRCLTVCVQHLGCVGVNQHTQNHLMLSKQNNTDLHLDTGLVLCISHASNVAGCPFLSV